MNTRRQFLRTLLGGAAAASFPRATLLRQSPPASQEDDLASAKAAKGSKAERAAKPLRILLLGGHRVPGARTWWRMRGRVGHKVDPLQPGQDASRAVPGGREAARRPQRAARMRLKGRSWDAAIDTSGYVPRI